MASHSIETKMGIATVKLERCKNSGDDVSRVDFQDRSKKE